MKLKFKKNNKLYNEPKNDSAIEKLLNKLTQKKWNCTNWSTVNKFGNLKNWNVF